MTNADVIDKHYLPDKQPSAKEFFHPCHMNQPTVLTKKISNHKHHSCFIRMCNVLQIPKTPGGDSYMKQTGMLVVSLSGINFDFGLA